MDRARHPWYHVPRRHVEVPADAVDSERDRTRPRSSHRRAVVARPAKNPLPATVCALLPHDGSDSRSRRGRWRVDGVCVENRCHFSPRTRTGRGAHGRATLPATTSLGKELSGGSRALPLRPPLQTDLVLSAPTRSPIALGTVVYTGHPPDRADQGGPVGAGANSAPGS